MSKVAIQGSAAGTGTFTIAAPGTNTDRTLTLPDQTGTVLTNTGPFTANASASAGAVTVDASNNVGIGTSSPGARLHLTGSNVQLRFTNAAGTPATRHIALVDSDNSWRFTRTGVADDMIIDSSGNLLVGTTSNGGFAAARLHILAPGGGGGGRVQVTNNGDWAFFFCNNAGTVVGNISAGSSSTAYNTTSDYRLKENVQPMAGALARVSALKPCTYTWKTTGEQGEGFIAHELQAVVPDAVTGTKDAVNEDGSIKPQGIDTSFLVATLTAAIQEQQALIESLTARIAALEGTANGTSGDSA